MPATDPRIIGYRWPRLARCPTCASDDTRVVTTQGQIQWRRCCVCGRRAKVLATHREVDRGGAWSEIEPVAGRE